jgi:nanoRNase/pAp phosphatase (c-di-AMP/oligoRNAs hydrolase)
MDFNQQTLNHLSEIITKGTAGVIVVPLNPTTDTLAAASSLYLGLTKLGKTVALASSSPIKSDLPATDKFQTNLNTVGNSLVVSFPYSDGAIDKVDYNIQGNFFNLIIAPRQGFPKLNPQQVKFNYAGGAVDFIIVVDAPNLNSLGTIYTDNPNQFQGKDIINIDRHLTNGEFGTTNLVDKTSSSTSELMYKILLSLGIELDKDVATNLYAGLAAATNNFTSYSVNANTFETAANLLKLGAVKRPMRTTPPLNRPVINQQPTVPQQPIGTVEQEPKVDESAPKDWLKPKIFRGGGLV